MLSLGFFLSEKATPTLKDTPGSPERDPLREFSDHTGKCHGGHFE